MPCRRPIRSSHWRPQTALASLEAGGDNYFIAQVIVGTAAGEDPATVHARLQGIDRNNSKLAIWDFADAVEAALSVNQP